MGKEEKYERLIKKEISSLNKRIKDYNYKFGRHKLSSTEAKKKAGVKSAITRKKQQISSLKVLIEVEKITKVDFNFYLSKKVAEKLQSSGFIKNIPANNKLLEFFSNTNHKKYKDEKVNILNKMLDSPGFNGKEFLGIGNEIEKISLISNVDLDIIEEFIEEEKPKININKF